MIKKTVTVPAVCRKYYVLGIGATERLVHVRYRTPGYPVQHWSQRPETRSTNSSAVTPLWTSHTMDLERRRICMTWRDTHTIRLNK